MNAWSEGTTPTFMWELMQPNGSRSWTKLTQCWATQRSGAVQSHLALRHGEGGRPIGEAPRPPSRERQPQRAEHNLGVNGTVDLALAVASALATTLIVLLVPSVEPARITLGLVFVLFLPGYVLVAALYPRKDDLDLVERLALSLGLSIAVVPLIGLALNYSPWGIRLDPILAFLTLFIVLAASVAVYRRLILPRVRPWPFP